MTMPPSSARQHHQDGARCRRRTRAALSLIAGRPALRGADHTAPAPRPPPWPPQQRSDLGEEGDRLAADSAHGEVGVAPRAPVHGSGSSVAGPHPASGVAHSVAALCSASTPAHTATHTLHRFDGYDWMILPVVKACEYLTLRLSAGEGKLVGGLGV